MKFVTFSTSNSALRPGLLSDDGIQTIPFASLMDLIQAGDEGLERVRDLRDKSRIPLNEVRLHAPISRPTTLRDGYAFEKRIQKPCRAELRQRVEFGCHSPSLLCTILRSRLSSSPSMALSCRILRTSSS